MGRWVGLIETDFFFSPLCFVCLRGGRVKGETVLYGSRRSAFLTNEKRKASWEQGTRTEEWSGGQWRREGDYYSGLTDPLVGTGKQLVQTEYSGGGYIYSHIRHDLRRK